MQGQHVAVKTMVPWISAPPHSQYGNVDTAWCCLSAKAALHTVYISSQNLGAETNMPSGCGRKRPLLSWCVGGGQEHQPRPPPHQFHQAAVCHLRSLREALARLRLV